jgi:phospholipid transport system substrate-binding protein
MKLIRTSIVAFFCLCASVTWAAGSASPMPMLKSTTGRLLISLKQNRAKLRSQPTFVYSLVRKILLPRVDVRVMSMTVLGRSGWYKATPSQRTQFTKTFTTTVIKTYASALNAYTDETVKFFPVRGGTRGRSVLQVNSQIIRPDGPPVPVSYSVVLRSRVWKIYDLTVEGISLLQSFRSQFASQLAQGDSVAKIIANLKRHNTKMK